MLYNRWHNGNESYRGVKRIRHRSMHTSEVTVVPGSLNISVSNDQELKYQKQDRDEKNWVPWEVSRELQCTDRIMHI